MKIGVIVAIMVIVLAGAVMAGYFLMQSDKNVTGNVTNNTNVNNTTDSSSGNTQQIQNTQSSNNLISAAQAKIIADNYLNSDSRYVNFDAGTPSLQGTVYYVPMVVNNDNSQSSKGTVVGNVKVDGRTGSVLGTQSWDIETNEQIHESP